MVLGTVGGAVMLCEPLTRLIQVELLYAMSQVVVSDQLIMLETGEPNLQVLWFANAEKKSKTIICLCGIQTKAPDLAPDSTAFNVPMCWVPKIEW